jgi:outer membrane protein
MKNKFIIAVFVFIFNQLYAQQPLSLTEAVESALTNNYQVLIAYTNTEIAKNNNTWGAAGLYPTLSLILADNNRLQKINNPASFINGDLTTIGFSGQVDVQWTIFNGLRVYANKTRLQAIQNQTQGRATIIIQNTLQAVILAYFDVLVEKEKLSTLEKTKKLSEERLAYIRLKKSIGTLTTFDELQAETAYNNDLQNFLLQEVNYKNSTRQLKQVMADNSSFEYKLTDSLFVNQMNYEAQQLKQTVLLNNEQLKNEYINQEILKKQYEAERANLFPRVNVNAGTSQSQSILKLNSNPSRTGTNADYYINFSLNYNLFNNGTVRRNMENAKLQREIGKLTMEEMKQSMSLRVESEVDNYNARKSLLKVAENNVSLNRKNLQIGEERFKNGTLTSFEFRDIQLNALRAEMNRLDAIYNLITSETEIMRLTGGMLKE